MKSQPNRNYKSDDVVMTPLPLAIKIVNHFKPSGKILEPCEGSGNFTRAIETFINTNIDTCEITDGRDFFECTDKYDWIITNPPWSQMRKFLQHSMELANNIVFLITINHYWTKARLRDIQNEEFGIKEICRVNTPESFPQSGFQLGAIYIKRGYLRECKISKI